MEAVEKISLAEIKKKLNRKSAIVDFFRELGKYLLFNKLKDIFIRIFLVLIMNFVSKC